MKNVLVLSSIALLMTASCKCDDVEVTVKNAGKNQAIPVYLTDDNSTPVRTICTPVAYKTNLGSYRPEFAKNQTLVVEYVHVALTAKSDANKGIRVKYGNLMEDFLVRTRRLEKTDYFSEHVNYVLKSGESIEFSHDGSPPSEGSVFLTGKLYKIE